MCELFVDNIYFDEEKLINGVQKMTACKIIMNICLKIYNQIGFVSEDVQHFYHIHVAVYAEFTITVCSAYEHPPEVLRPPEQDDRQWTRDYLQVHQDHFCVLTQDGFHRTHLNKPWGKFFIKHQSGQKGKEGGSFLFSGFVMKHLCDLYVKQILYNVHALCIASEVIIFILSCLRLYNLVWKYKTSLK